MSGIIFEDFKFDITGANIPQKILNFKESKIHYNILKNITYNIPTPVQKHAIPIILEGRDLMTCSQTGSGKTAAFLLPLLDLVNKEISYPLYKNQMFKMNPFVIILSPTRELANQIYQEALTFSYQTLININVVYGGVEYKSQLKDLNTIKNYECHMLVATPGRLLDLYEHNRVSFANVKCLVLDEVDRLLDMGFEPQIREIIEEKNMPNHNIRQTLMFSATFSKRIQVMAGNFLKIDHIFLNIDCLCAKSSSIKQYLEWVEESEKNSFLIDILKRDENDLIVIFVETKLCAQEIENFLTSLGFEAVSIHGNKLQIERENALSAFKSGIKNILVATAVAARGLDVPNVKLVVNYDLPNNIDEYVHRIGRTGRAGLSGIAISFFNNKNQNLSKDLLNFLNETGQFLPQFLQSTSKRYSTIKNNSLINKSISIEKQKINKVDIQETAKESKESNAIKIKTNNSDFDWFDHE